MNIDTPPERVTINPVLLIKEGVKMNYTEIMKQEISVSMTRDQLSIIRAAYSSWLDHQESITPEYTDIENMLNEFYPVIKGKRYYTL